MAYQRPQLGYQKPNIFNYILPFVTLAWVLIKYKQLKQLPSGFGINGIPLSFTDVTPTPFIILIGLQFIISVLAIGAEFVLKKQITKEKIAADFGDTMTKIFAWIGVLLNLAAVAIIGAYIRTGVSPASKDSNLHITALVVLGLAIIVLIVYGIIRILQSGRVKKDY